MLVNGIISPAILSLLGRTRRRNMLLITDGGTGLKARASGVIGIIRAGDTTRFGNVLLESASLAMAQNPQP